MKEMIADYKALIEDITQEVNEGMLKETDSIQIIRHEEPVFQDYRPILDWYYDEKTMKEDLETPLEEMYMEEEYSKEEWKQMKEDLSAYREQYLQEKDQLEPITVKAALTEMKQMIKLFGK